LAADDGAFIVNNRGDAAPIEMPKPHGVDATAPDRCAPRIGALIKRHFCIPPPPPSLGSASMGAEAMRTFLRIASVVLFALLGACLLWFGWVYASVDDLLWFHAAAAPESARGVIRPLYLALMNLIGGSSIGLGALGLYVTAAMLPRGDAKAALAVAIAYAVPFVMAALTAEELAKAGAPTSWHIMGVLLAATALAFLAHAASCAIARPSS
jgi:hypothetical protein